MSKSLRLARATRESLASVSICALALIAITGCSGESATEPSASPGPTSAPAPQRLRVSAIPDVNPDRMQTQYQPYAEYLSAQLGIPVDFTPVTDYPATVEGIAAGKLDLVWFGGYTSVQAIRQCQGEAERLVLREEDAKFRSVFITRPDTGIRSLADLRGHSFAFGSESSTSGHLMPRHYLAEAGIDVKGDLGNVSFSGAHDATVKFVEEGKVDAGALNILVWQRLEKEGKIDPSKVVVFYETPEYVDYCWVASRRLPADLRARIKKAFLALDPAKPEDKALLELHNASRYMAASDDDWKGIEAAATAAGMLK
jgi:phosphonate transport system substrate-binding protein